MIIIVILFIINRCNTYLQQNVLKMSIRLYHIEKYEISKKFIKMEFSNFLLLTIMVEGGGVFTLQNYCLTGR